MSRTASTLEVQDDFVLQKELEKFTRRALEDTGSSDYAPLVRMVEELAAQVAVFLEKASNTMAHKRTVEQFRSLLRSISSNASRIQENRHEKLLRALFKLNLWRLPQEVQDPLADLMVHLTWVRIGLQDACIQFLVTNFCLPHATRAAVPQDNAASSRQPHSPSPAELSAHACALNTLNKLITQQPLSTRLVKDALDQHFPHRCQPRERLCAYVRAMLQLAEMPAGKFLWDSTFETTVRRLVEIDAEIRWEGIVEQLRGQEDEDGSESDGIDPDDLHTTAALFAGDSDCEMDGAVDDSATRVDCSTHTAAMLGTAEDTKLGFEGHACKQRRSQPHRAEDDVGPNSSLEMAHRLDPLMGMLFDHMRVRAREDPARLWRDCMHAFDSILLGSQRIKFTPYVVFFAAHITGAGNARKFAADLVARVCDPAESKSRRITCAAYAGSFLARFAPLPLSDVLYCLERLVRFATDYAARAAGRASLHRCASMLAPSTMLAGSSGFERSFSTGAFEVQGTNQDQHDVFYASCQAAMYSVCFHGNCLSPSAAPPSGDGSVTAATDQCAALRSLVQNGLIPLMRCPLNPLQACLPTVTDEFARTLVRHGLEDLSQLPNLPGTAAAPRRKVRCDTYFPFDPYLLPLSTPGLKLQAFYCNWGKHGVPAGETPSAQTVVEPEIEDCSDSDDDSTLDGGSDEGDAGMVGSVGAGQALDMPMLALSADKAGTQNMFVNPFAGAPQRHVAVVRCPGADEAMGHSPHSDGGESPAYGSFGPSPPGAFGPKAFKESAYKKQASSSLQCTNGVQANKCIAG